MSDFTDDHTPPQDAPSQDAPPPPPPGPAPRPLLRRDDDKVFAGVAGGLADYLGVDPTVVRVAFAVLAIFGGVGLPIYLVGWVGMRTPSMPESHLEQWFRGAPNPAALIALAVGFIVLINVLDTGRGPGNGIGWGLALLFAGWLLFRADSRAVTGGAAAPPQPADPAGWATGSGDQGAWSSSGTWYGPGGTAAPTRPVWEPVQPRPRSILGRLTVGIMLAVLGAAALLDQLGALALAPVQYAALAMTLTGLGLVVGAWIGRAYGLIVLGLFLVPVMIVTSIAPLPLRGGVGEVSHQPAAITAVRDAYTLGAGELEVDLSGIDFEGTTRHITVSVGVGETTIIVPDDVTVAVDGEMRVGQANLFGVTTVGRPFLGDLSKIDEGSVPGRLQLSIDNGLGELTVRRASQER